VRRGNPSRDVHEVLLGTPFAETLVGLFGLDLRDESVRSGVPVEVAEKLER
jgi:hypothetical protein